MKTMRTVFLLSGLSIALSACATVSMRGDARLTDFRTDRLSGLVGMVDSSVHFGVKLPKVETGYAHAKAIRVRGLPPAARIEYYLPTIQGILVGQVERESQDRIILDVSARNVNGRILISEQIALRSANPQSALLNISKAVADYADYDLVVTVKRPSTRATDSIEIWGTGPSHRFY
jgi:hypothetical protein